MTTALFPRAFFAIILLGTGLQAQELPPGAVRMRDDLKILASDEYEGRGIGTAGLDKAADYIAEQFKLAGLNVTSVNGGPFQNFEIPDGSKLGAVNTLTFSGPNGKKLDLKLGQAFCVCGFGGSGRIRAPLVFLGYGIEARDVGYDDYQGIDVRGRVVVFMRRNPLQKDPKGPFAVGHGVSRYAALTSKVSQAVARGAVGVLIVNDPTTGRDQQTILQEQVRKAEMKVESIANKMVAPDAPVDELLNEMQQALDQLKRARDEFAADNPDPLMAFEYGGTRPGTSPPCFQITQKIADEILKSATSYTLEQLETRIDEFRRPSSLHLNGWTVEATSSVEQLKQPVKNVIGVLPGEGTLQEETIVIGAHYDHLGTGGNSSLAPDVNEIHNGADDNGSGTVALLELARRLGKREKPLPRRVVFVAFTAEERGLIGSIEYVKAPTFPLASTVAMFNMDMVGRLGEHKLIVYGTGTSRRWSSLLDPEASRLHLAVSKTPQGFGPSDQTSFYAKRIPVLHFFTGLHADYHPPEDDWEKIDYVGMDRITTLLENIVVATAENPARPDFISIAGEAPLERISNRPYFGSIPDFSSEAAGYAIQGVVAGSPAESGGLQSGDVIVKLGGKQVANMGDFDLALQKFTSGQQIDVTVLRDGQEKDLKVTLSTPRG